MIQISHRGYINGPDDILENNPKHIQTLLNKGVDVEIDVWLIDKKIYLGHDKPLHAVTKKFLTHKNLWCHAKNLEALSALLKLKTICFWHQEDNYTLTSNNYIWTYPNILVNKDCIIVDTSPGWFNKHYKCAGVCVDYLKL